MPISYTIDKHRKLILTKVSGILTDDELYHHKRSLMNDPQFEPGMRELSDVREIKELHVTSSGVWSMASIDKEHAEKLQSFKLAIIASEDIVFGMARMYQSLTQPSLPQVNVFRNEEEAMKWLDY